MRRQLVPGLVVRLTVIKAKTRPGIEAKRPQGFFENYHYTAAVICMTAKAGKGLKPEKK